MIHLLPIALSELNLMVIGEMFALQVTKELSEVQDVLETETLYLVLENLLLDAQHPISPSH